MEGEGGRERGKGQLITINDEAIALCLKSTLGLAHCGSLTCTPG